MLDLRELTTYLMRRVEILKIFETARTNIVSRSKEQFRLEDGVPMSESDGVSWRWL